MIFQEENKLRLHLLIKKLILLLIFQNRTRNRHNVCDVCTAYKGLQRFTVAKSDGALFKMIKWVFFFFKFNLLKLLQFKYFQSAKPGRAIAPNYERSGIKRTRLRHQRRVELRRGRV